MVIPTNCESYRIDNICQNTYYFSISCSLSLNYTTNNIYNQPLTVFSTAPSGHMREALLDTKKAHYLSYLNQPWQKIYVSNPSACVMMCDRSTAMQQQ